MTFPDIMLIDPQTLQKTFTRHRASLCILAIGACIALFLRVWNLGLWPIFADEAIYIRWSQVMRSEPTLRFLPLTDGKQPLFMWLAIPFLKLITDPLIAARSLSILTGMASFVGMYALTWRLTTNQRIAVIASLLYATIPYTVFFDRYALADSLLTACFIWTLYFVITNLHKQQLVFMLLAGISWGIAAITKSPALMLSVIIPSTMMLVPGKHHARLLWMNFVASYVLMAIIAGVIYNLLRLGPEFHQIALRNHDYVYPLFELQTNPFFPFIPNIQSIFSFYWYLLTPGIFSLAIGSGIIVWKKKRDRRILLWLLVWAGIPILSQAALARNITARYLLYTVPPLIIAAAIALEPVIPIVVPRMDKLSDKISRKKKILAKCAIGLISFPLIYQLVTLLFAPQQMLLPRIERSGYLEEWTSGTGLRQMADFIANQSNTNEVVVGTEGFFGTTPDGLVIYFDKNPQVHIIGNSYLLDSVPSFLYDAARTGKSAYLIINNDRLHLSDPEQAGLHVLFSYPKATRPDGTHQSLNLYQVTDK